MKISYINVWYDPHFRSGPMAFECDSLPVEYRGYEIYHRLPDVFDIVINGGCIAHAASMREAEIHVDRLLMIVGTTKTITLCGNTTCTD